MNVIQKIFQKFLTKATVLALSGVLLLPLFSSASWGMKEEDEEAPTRHLPTLTVLNTTEKTIEWTVHVAYEDSGPYFLVDDNESIKGFNIYPLLLVRLPPHEETAIELGLPDRSKKIYGVTTLPDGVGLKSTPWQRAFTVKPFVKWDKLPELPTTLKAAFEMAEGRNKHPEITENVMDIASVVETTASHNFPVNLPSGLYPLEDLITPKVKFVIGLVSPLPGEPPSLTLFGCRGEKIAKYEELKAKMNKDQPSSSFCEIL